jgi:hypothetical protein
VVSDLRFEVRTASRSSQKRTRSAPKAGVVFLAIAVVSGLYLRAEALLFRHVVGGGCQSTVRVKVVVCESDPDVAVSVTVELLVLGAAEDPLPQPLSRLSPTKLIAISNSI